MPRENAEVLRRAYRGYEGAAAGDEDLAAVIAGFADPAIEWHSVQEPNPKHGPKGVLEAMQGWFDAWADLRIRPERIREAPQTILVYARVSGRGRTSDLRVSELFFHVWTMRDGKAIRFREFSDEKEALEARRAVGVNSCWRSIPIHEMPMLAACFSGLRDCFFGSSPPSSRSTFSTPKLVCGLRS